MFGCAIQAATLPLLIGQLPSDAIQATVPSSVRQIGLSSIALLLLLLLLLLLF
jgi:hypothetical protein